MQPSSDPPDPPAQPDASAPLGAATDPTVELRVSPQSLLGGLLLVGLAVALWQIRQVLVLVFIAWLIAATLYPAVHWLERRQLPRGLGILIFYLLFLGVLVLLGALLGDLLLTQAARLHQDFPDMLAQWSHYLRHIPGLPTQLELQGVLLDNAQAIAGQATDVVRSTLGFFMSVFRRILDIIALLVLTFLMLLKPQTLESAVLLLFPQQKRPRMAQFLTTISPRLGGYIRGQLLIASLLGVAVWLGLTLLGVDYALLLALSALLLNLVPILGSLLASVLGIAVALAETPWIALWTALLYLVLNQLEAHLLGPVILGRSVGLSPFWVIVSVMVGGSLYGVPGVFLAIPLAALIKMALDEFVWQAHQPPSSPGPHDTAH